METELLNLTNRLEKAYGPEIGHRVAVKAYLLNAKVKQYQRKTAKGKVVTVHEHQTKVQPRRGKSSWDNPNETHHVSKARAALAEAYGLHDAAMKTHSAEDHKKAKEAFEKTYDHLQDAAAATSGKGGYKKAITDVLDHIIYHEDAMGAAKASSKANSGKSSNAHEIASTRHSEAAFSASRAGLSGVGYHHAQDAQHTAHSYGLGRVNYVGVAGGTHRRGGKMQIRNRNDCTACGGSGAKDRAACPVCGGTGDKQDQEKPKAQDDCCDKHKVENCKQCNCGEKEVRNRIVIRK